MYSGLLQTNQELAKAKAEASAGVGKGLAEGFKPLQGYLMGVAAKEQKRLDQLDSDMGIAGAYLGKMSDTAGILGEYEQEITDFGVLEGSHRLGVAIPCRNVAFGGPKLGW